MNLLIASAIIATIVLIVAWRRGLIKVPAGAGSIASALPSSKIGKEALTIVALVIGALLFWFIGWEHFKALSFFYKLVLGAGLIYLANLLSKKPEMSLASTARYAGAFLLIIAGLTSGFGLWLGDTVNSVEAKVRGEETAALSGKVECPEPGQNLEIGSIIVYPVNCKVDVDAYMIRDGNFELAFADKSLPIVNGIQLLNGKPIQAYVTSTYAYKGREGHGMRFTTVDPSAFKEAGLNSVKIEVLKWGAIEERGKANANLNDAATKLLADAQQ